jgi:hypothetical protein
MTASNGQQWDQSKILVSLYEAVWLDLSETALGHQPRPVSEPLKQELVVLTARLSHGSYVFKLFNSTPSFIVKVNYNELL